MKYKAEGVEIQSDLHILEGNKRWISTVLRWRQCGLMAANSAFASLSVKNQSNVAIACTPRNACGWWVRLVDCLKSEAVDIEEVGKRCDCDRRREGRRSSWACRCIFVGDLALVRLQDLRAPCRENRLVELLIMDFGFFDVVSRACYGATSYFSRLPPRYRWLEDILNIEVLIWVPQGPARFAVSPLSTWLSNVFFT
jgi:hypothetical protein